MKFCRASQQGLTFEGPLTIKLQFDWILVQYLILLGLLL